MQFGYLLLNTRHWSYPGPYWFGLYYIRCHSSLEPEEKDRFGGHCVANRVANGKRLAVISLCTFGLTTFTFSANETLLHIL